MTAEIIPFKTTVKGWDVMAIVQEVVADDREIERNLLLQRAQDIGLELVRKARSYGLPMGDDGRIK